MIKVISAVIAVRGVESVQNQITAHAAPDGIPALQHDSERPVRRTRWLRGSWSPSARAVMGLLGGGLFLYGLTQKAPTACVLGGVGLGLMAEGFTNVGLDDVAGLSHRAAEAAGRVADSLGVGGQARSAAGDVSRPAPASV